MGPKAGAWKSHTKLPSISGKQPDGPGGEMESTHEVGSLDLDLPSGTISKPFIQRQNQALSNRTDKEVRSMANKLRKDVKAINKDTEMELQRLRKILSVAPVSTYEISAIHRRRKKDLKELCVHLTMCYLRKQELNKEKWREDVRRGELNHRPVKTPDHREFFDRVFPSIYSSLTDEDFDEYRYDPELDLYRNSKYYQPHNYSSAQKMKLAEKFHYKQPLHMGAWLPPIEVYLPDVKRGDQSTEYEHSSMSESDRLGPVNNDQPRG